MTTAERIRKARRGDFNKPQPQRMQQVEFKGRCYAVPVCMAPATFKARMSRNGGDYQDAISKPVKLRVSNAWQPGMYSGRTELSDDQRAAVAKHGVKP